jgi:hypothetical protein
MPRIKQSHLKRINMGNPHMQSKTTHGGYPSSAAMQVPSPAPDASYVPGKTMNTMENALWKIWDDLRTDDGFAGTYSSREAMKRHIDHLFADKPQGEQLLREQVRAAIHDIFNRRGDSTPDANTNQMIRTLSRVVGDFTRYHTEAIAKKNDLVNMGRLMKYGKPTNDQWSALETCMAQYSKARDITLDLDLCLGGRSKHTLTQELPTPSMPSRSPTP